jgi:short-subunit dehydrogenase
VYGPLSTISREQMEQQFSANFLARTSSPCACCPPCSARRRPHCDDLLGNGADFDPGRGAYAASKYALEAWSDALRMELRHSGIKVSLIEPGPIRTRFTDNVNQTQRQTGGKPRYCRTFYPRPGGGRRQSAPCF